MTDKDRKNLLELAETVRDLFEIQAAANRTVHALFLALKTQLPGLEEAYPKARKDSRFATRESVSTWKTSQKVEKIIDRLRHDLEEG